MEGISVCREREREIEGIGVCREREMEGVSIYKEGERVVDTSC